MIAIVDYKAGNLTSVQLAFRALGCEAAVTSDPRVILSAERVVFPGVGAAGSAMRNLAGLHLVDALKQMRQNRRGTLQDELPDHLDDEEPGDYAPSFDDVNEIHPDTVAIVPADEDAVVRDIFDPKKRR